MNGTHRCNDYINFINTPVVDQVSPQSIYVVGLWSTARKTPLWGKGWCFYSPSKTFFFEVATFCAKGFLAAAT